MPLPLAWLIAAAATATAACSFEPTAGTPDGDASPDVQPDPTGDPDTDGIPSAGDNCPDAANPDQLDSDTDGVGDACDNCPQNVNPPLATMGAAAPIQRDHDADGRGDECDLCPHIPSTLPVTIAEPDQDADQIGDSCDPEVDIPNPTRYWNGFYDPPDSQWVAVAGPKSDWEVAVGPGGGLGWRQKSLEESRRQIYLDDRNQEHFVRSVIAVDQVAPKTATALRSATLTLGFGFTGPGNTGQLYFSCGVRRDLDANSSVLVTGSQFDDTDTPESRGQALWQGAFTDPVAVTGRGDRVGSTQQNQGDTALTCNAAAGAATNASANITSAYAPDGRVGLRTYGVTAWFDYIFVVEPRPRS